MNVYDYLDQMLAAFWQAVFNKTPEAAGCSGLVDAHGDKTDQYRDRWEEAGVPYFHGALIYLLTFTDQLGDTPKHQSCEWVIENYPVYQFYILRIEQAMKQQARRAAEVIHEPAV